MRKFLAKMMMLTVMTLGSSVGGLAQPDSRPPRPPRHGRPVGQAPASMDRLLHDHAERLGLDDEALAQISSISAKARRLHRELELELREAERRMHALLAEDLPDEVEVLGAVDQVGVTRNQITRERIRAMLRIRSALTREQRDGLIELQKEIEAKRRARRPLGPRHMGEGREEGRGERRGARGGSGHEGPPPF